MKRIRKTGICIAGPACSVWKRSAMPVPHRVAVRLTSSASESNPTSCAGSPSTCMPESSAATVTTVPVSRKRAMAASA